MILPSFCNGRDNRQTLIDMSIGDSAMNSVRILLAALVMLIVSSAVSAQDGLTLEILDHDGVERSYYLYVPDDVSESEPASLMIALHPRTSSGYAMMTLTGFNDAADENGFIVAYPNAETTFWASDPDEDGAADDIGFLGSLIDTVAEDYVLENVYLTGFGNGAVFTYRAACEMSLDGVAAVGALLWEFQTELCDDVGDSDPVDMLIVHGDADPFYEVEDHTLEPLFGGEVREIYGEESTISYWASKFGCEGAPTEGEQTSHYADCADDTQVGLYRVLGGGQNWPRINDHALNQFGVDATEMIVSFFNRDDVWMEPQAETFEDNARTYVYYVPSSYDPSEPMPVVVLLHGRFGSGAGTAQHAEMSRIAEEEGFIGVYPNGLPYESDIAGDTGWRYDIAPPGEIRVDDVQFILDMMADLSLDLNLDTSRMYVTGLSNGGFMVHRLACEVGDLFAGYSTVAGSGYFGMFQTCNPEIGVPMMVIHGTADNNVLWNGRIANLGGQQVYSTQPILDVVAFWAQTNECSPEFDSEDLPQEMSQQTVVRVMRFGECRDDSEVVLVGIINGGHNWPGIGSGIPDEVAGDVNLDLNAGEYMWAWFKDFSRPAETD